MAPTEMYLKYIFFHFLSIPHESVIPWNPVLKHQIYYALLGFECELPCIKACGSFRRQSLAGGSGLLERQAFLSCLCFWSMDV